MLVDAFQELLEYKSLLYMISWREIRLKYQQSVMGFFWAVLMPMLIVAVGFLVKIAASRLSGTPMQVSDLFSVAVKAVPYSFFISTIRFSTNSLTGNASLVTKIYFPKEILPISAVLSQFFDFLVAAGTLAIALAFSRTGWGIHLLWVPLLVLVLLLFSLALGIFLSAANLFLRDVKYLVEVGVSFAIFFTPVFYDVRIAGQYQWILLMNPVAPLLEGFTSAIVSNQAPCLIWLLYSTCVSFGAVFVSLRFFKKLEPRFAEFI